MRLPAIALLTLIILLGFTAAAWAVVTPAGTPITNKATAAYKVGAANMTKDSNILTIKVAELINVAVVSLDGGNLNVTPGTNNQYLTFQVSNTGNGPESFTFAVNNGSGGDQFDPSLVGIFADTNGDGVYSVGDLAIPGGTLNMAIGATFKVFVVSNIPSLGTDGITPLADGNQGITAITITSTTGSGPKGTVFAGAGTGAVDAVLGATAGLPLSSTATYTINSISVDINKTSLVAHPDYGTQPVPGATITYSLAVTVTGTGTATDLTITDPIPAFTTYKPGTLTLTGSPPLTDGAGDDVGEATGTPVNLITVRLGNMTAGTKTITFAVTID